MMGKTKKDIKIALDAVKAMLISNFSDVGTEGYEDHRTVTYDERVESALAFEVPGQLIDDPEGEDCPRIDIGGCTSIEPWLCNDYDSRCHKRRPATISDLLARGL